MRQYLVANHLFTVEAPESFFDVMTNYVPFELPSSNSDSALTSNSEAFQHPLFHLFVEEPVAHLPELSAEWESVFIDTSEPELPRIEVYRSQTGWLIRQAFNRDAEAMLQVSANHDFSQAQLLATKPSRFAVDGAAMLVYAFASLPYQTLELHASVTVRDDWAYLFLGKSGTGKSTHSQLWQKAFPDAWLLNDDNPILRLTPEGPVVYGSPWSGKTPCYKNDSKPVGAFVKLEQAPHNQIRRLSLPEAYAYILASASGLKIVPEMMDVMYATIAQFVQQTPGYYLECLPNTDAACLCATTITPK